MREAGENSNDSYKDMIKLYKNYEASVNAVLPLSELLLDESAVGKFLPPAVRIGNIVSDSDYASINSQNYPVLLPFSDNDANAFVITQENEKDVHTLFFNIAFRLMLSLPANLFSFHFVDMQSMGGKCKIINNLTNEKIFKNAIIKNDKELLDLVSTLEEKIQNVNSAYLSKSLCDDLEAYNMETKSSVLYNFVFILNFPQGFSSDLLNKLSKLVNGNARKAGIFIFYSIDKTPTSVYGFDPEQFLSKSVVISLSEDNRNYKIENCKIKNLFNDKCGVHIESQLPDNLDAIFETINKKELPKVITSFDSEFSEMMQTGNYWKGDSRLGVKIPIGIKPVNEKVYFEFGGDTADYFAMVGGRPGYGKTVLLHDIICNGSVLYSPEELQFFLIDCKDGVGFNAYKNLPHTSFISIDNNLDFILNALSILQNEMTVRANLFKKASEKHNTVIAKFEDYREVTGEKLPRIILVIDEFQKLLDGGYKQAGAASSALQDLIKRGRSAGINIVFCTQSYKGVEFETNLITLRIAFSLEEYDSEKVLRNGAATDLRQRGAAILNRTGDRKDNIHFQGAYIDEKKDLLKYVTFSQQKLKEDLPYFNPVKYTPEEPNLFNNQYFINLLSADTKDKLSGNRIYLGVPYYISKEHIGFSLNNKNAANLILIGNEIKVAMSSILLANWQLSLQNSKNSEFYIVDFLNSDHPYANYYADFAKNVNNIHVVTKVNLAQLVDDIENKLNIRIENEKNNKSNIGEGKVVLSLSYIQAAKELKKVGFTDSLITTKLIKLLKDGSEYGIHLIFYAYSIEGLYDNMFENKILNWFENKILLQGGKFTTTDDYNIKTGFGLINSELYKNIPFRFYNTFEGKVKPKLQAIFEQIFSIFKNEENE